MRPRPVRGRPYLLFLCLWLSATSLAGGSGNAAPLLDTGVTGGIRASGLNDPQYALSFVPVQRLMLRLVAGPVSEDSASIALKDTPVSLNDLLGLGLVRRETDGVYLNYLLLTVDDQRAIYEHARVYGKSLADAFRARHPAFEAQLERYRDAPLRDELAFALIAGAALNWGGLELTTTLGYRAEPPHHPNGDVYFVHSSERGAHLSHQGLYLDSESVPGPKMSFATFGDGPSLPRLRGIPDVFDVLDEALQPWRETPDVYAGLRNEYLNYIFLAINEAGAVMYAVAASAETKVAIAAAVEMPAARLDANLDLLAAISYLHNEGENYRIAVPVLRAQDKDMVDSVLQLSEDIMTAWLRTHYPDMEDDLSGLSPMRNGVPFALAFSEVWHYTFGFAAKSLAESGFFTDPRAQGRAFEGYVPLVWESPVLRTPGS